MHKAIFQSTGYFIIYCILYLLLNSEKKMTEWARTILIINEKKEVFFILF